MSYLQLTGSGLLGGGRRQFFVNKTMLSHLLSDNAEFLLSCKGKHLLICLVNQPAQSPDLNINNLGFFRLIDCLHKKIIAKNLGELIDAVHVVYDNLPVCTIDDAFITLMAQMNEILHHGGRNNFPLPHMKKQQHERKMGASMRTIKSNVPTFVPTKASQPTFVFDNSNVNSNNKTVNKENEGANNNTNDNNNNNKNNQEVFYGTAI